MRFLTEDESRAWAEGRGFSVSPPRRPEQAIDALPHIRVGLPSEPGGILGFCRVIAGLLSPRSSCLLWVVTWSVWPSSENWHLYYKLRQGYGDHRLLQEGPGHLFLDYEEADLVSFLQLTLSSGWDAEILPDLTYGGPQTARAFVSHDEWVALSHCDAATLEEWRRELAEVGYAVLTEGAG